MSRHPVDDRVAVGTVGPPANGISMLARRLAAAATAQGFGGTVVDEPDPGRLPALVRQLPAGVRVLHLHVSDWMFADAGVDPAGMPAALDPELAGRGIRLALSLHDVPQWSDGPQLVRRRAATYRRWTERAAQVVVSSEHERALLGEVVGGPAGPVAVVPLPIDPLAVDPLAIDPVPGDPAPEPGETARDPTGDPVVAVFGFLYPGKGHRELIEELTGVGPGLTVLAVGRPSQRHPELPADLGRQAAARGLRFRVTGFVPDAELAGQLRAPVVPVAPQTRISASASINAWIGAGRRPLVADGRYARELAARLPGAIRIYPPGGLSDQVRLAILDPARTWLPAGVPIGPTTRTVAATYLAGWRELAARG